MRNNSAGSAFVIALMVMVVLTFIGLSLAMVTETEMLLGSNERVINRTFYSADSGIAAAVSQLMVTNSFDKLAFGMLDQPDRPNQPQFIHRVETTSLYPVRFQPAPESTANQGSDTVYSGFFFGRMRARRVLDDAFQSERVLSYGSYISPLQEFEGGALWNGFLEAEVFHSEQKY
ncbi:MAG: hypothetical protein HC897_00400 [Thermoanaerobaculia bacterium]|nr:hypothetical protein [Thermoanaerobaculia bacterium]